MSHGSRQSFNHGPNSALNMNHGQKVVYIQDWAGNDLKFKSARSGLWLPCVFDSWDEAEDYLIELLGNDYDESRGEYYIMGAE